MDASSQRGKPGARRGLGLQLSFLVDCQSYTFQSYVLITIRADVKSDKKTKAYSDL